MKHTVRYPQKLTRAGECLVRLLEAEGRPVITHRDLFRLIWTMYRAERTGLRLRRETPAVDDYRRFRRQLIEANVIDRDPDYGERAWRVLTAHDLPADDVVCIVDPFCHVAYLSAMQRWGLTNRVPKKLTLARPDRVALKARLEVLDEGEKFQPWPATNIHHPEQVRRRVVQIHEARNPGSSVRNPSGFVRVATIGQTFLDMLQHPERCGGMSHVLDIWQEHAADWFDEIVGTVNSSSPKSIVKCRAGYILEERLGLRDEQIESWKSSAQRGGSRKLDPFKPYIPEYSEAWMISINA